MSNVFYYNSPYLIHYNHRHDPKTGRFARAGFNIGGAFQRNIKQGKGKENISPAESVTRSAEQGIKGTKQSIDSAISLRNRINRKKYQKNVDLSKKSDEEMRKYINRVNLERQYIDAITPQAKNEGLEYTSDIIGIIGGVASIATSAAIIAAVVKGR